GRRECPPDGVRAAPESLPVPKVREIGAGEVRDHAELVGIFGYYALALSLPQRKRQQVLHPPPPPFVPPFRASFDFDNDRGGAAGTPVQDGDLIAEQAVLGRGH